MIDKILQILEDSKWVAYEKSEVCGSHWSTTRYSAVQVISPTCIDRIKALYNLPINEEI
jgi:hypothetical protein